VRIVITGATGFVGRTLLSALSGNELLLALRTAADIAEFKSVVVGDINEQTSWDNALAGADCVIHLAARVHVMRPTPFDAQKFREVNVLGTARLAKAARQAGVRRFVFLSSIKVNGEDATTPFKNSDPPCPVDDYGRSKWEAEQALSDVANGSDMELAVIRPPLVYGPGVRANFLRLLSWVNNGVPLPFGAVHNRRSMVSVWNLCDLIKTVAVREPPTTGVYLVSDGTDLSTPELIRCLARGMNKPARLLPVPVGLLKLLGEVTGKSAEVSRLCGSLTVDISETRNRLNWLPPVPSVEGLTRVAEWYATQGQYGL
jgi:nucleoside-diphosphate-sugar epimerase